jgi:mannose-6-phosphate isomerase-like protein (cupin superfamily)
VDDLKGNQEEETFSFRPEFLFIIPPVIKHSIENRGSKTGYFIGFFDGEGKVESV